MKNYDLIAALLQEDLNACVKFNGLDVKGVEFVGKALYLTSDKIDTPYVEHEDTHERIEKIKQIAAILKS